MAGLSEAILQQVLNSVTSNPSLLSNMVEHPYSTIGNITHNDNVSKDEAAQVVTAITQLAGGQSVNLGSLAGTASQLLGQNNNSVHSLSSSLLGNLLGGGATSGGLFSAAQPVQQNPSLLETLLGGGKPAQKPDLGSSILANLAGVAFGGGVASNKQAIDLSDGFGLDDLIGIAGMLFK